MKKVTFIAIALTFLAIPAYASALTYVDGYYRSDGTYVEGHYRSAPDGYKYNNLGSDGIDMDGDGYGAGWTNPMYYDELNSYSSYNSYNSTYYPSWQMQPMDGWDYRFDSVDTYSSYESPFNSYGSRHDYTPSYNYSVGFSADVSDDGLNIMEPVSENEEEDEFDFGQIFADTMERIHKRGAAQELREWYNGSVFYSNESLVEDVSYFADEDTPVSKIVEILVDDGYLTEYNGNLIKEAARNQYQ